MKYKICKIVDGNNNVTYQIKKKGWLFWHWITVATGPLGHYEPLAFDTFVEAQNWLQDLLKCAEYVKKSRQTKIVECVEL